MLASLLAKAEGAREVAAVSTEFQHDKLFQSIGIDHVINPRMTAANQIMQLISRGHFGSVVKIRDADIQAVRLTISPNSDVSGVPLKKVWRKIQGKAIIGIIIRENEMIIPGGDTALEPDDHVIIIAYSRSVAGINKLFKAR
jgi:trk system potassium uptake protein TrkA